MSFRQFGGLKYAAKNNYVSSSYNTTGNLSVSQTVGEPNSNIVFLSDIVGGGKGTTQKTSVNYLNVGEGATGANTNSGTVLDVNGNTNITGYLNGINNPISYLPIDFSQFSQKWKTNSNYNNTWNSVAMSASGQYQTAVSYGGIIGGINGGIYYSTDYGTNWTLNTSSGSFFVAVAMSASGQYQTVSGGGIYYSTDYGKNWTLSTTSINPTSLAMSSSGQYQTAIFYNSNLIYFSIDFGKSWTTNSSTRNNWQSVAMSSSGQYQTVCGREIISYSTNFGISWITSNTSNISVLFVDMSSSGQYQTACGFGIFYSNDYGKTWKISNETNTLWTCIAISASGQYQTAIRGDNLIFYSTDFGKTWTNSQNSCGSSPVLAMSASGQYQTIVVKSGNIYTSVIPFDSNAAKPSSNASDYRIKEDITDLSLDEFTVDNLRPVYFKYKDSKKENIGLIAHELQEEIPFLVEGEKDGFNYQSVNYIGLIGVLIKEIQDLKKEVKLLKR
jgi:Chaperone of endosialidase/BNR/Asp-box repeat